MLQKKEMVVILCAKQCSNHLIFSTSDISSKINNKYKNLFVNFGNGSQLVISVINLLLVINSYWQNPCKSLKPWGKSYSGLLTFEGWDSTINFVGKCKTRYWHCLSSIKTGATLYFCWIRNKKQIDESTLNDLEKLVCLIYSQSS